MVFGSRDRPAQGRSLFFIDTFLNFQNKNPTSTREAGKNNIKIMKKIRHLETLSKRRIVHDIVKSLVFSLDKISNFI